MKLLTLFMVALVVSACQDTQENTNDGGSTIETDDSERFSKEIITRSYSVKMMDAEPVIDILQQFQSLIINPEGKEVQTTSYNLDGSVAWVDRYIYDENGNKIGSDYFDKGTKNTIYYMYEIDTKGRKIAYHAFDHGTDALLFEGATRYENFGKVKKDGYLTEKGDFICTFEYTFDDQGREVGYVYVDHAAQERYPSEYQYVELNDDDEWRKRLVLSDGKVKAIETREIIRNAVH